MALDASHVRVALTGNIWFSADLDTVIPDSFADTAMTGFTNLGYTTEDGVTFNFGREVEDINGWQSMDPLRKIVTAEPKSASYTLRQLERATWLATMGGTITTSGTGAAAVHRWEPDIAKTIDGIILIDFTDDDITYRFGMRRAQQTAEVEFSLVRNDAINLPNEWTALATGSGLKNFFMDTNDSAFAAA